jgi:hypothetical protein
MTPMLLGSAFCTPVLSTQVRRGDLQIDENVERELINHRTLIHPNIVRFREVSTR